MDWQLDKPDGEPDPLDRLLAEARWAEPGPDAVHRLRGQWRSLMVKRSRRRRRLLALATAGTLLAVGLAFWQCVGRTARPGLEDSIAESPSRQAPLPDAVKPITRVPRPRGRDQAATHGVAASLLGSLDPYQLVMLTAQRRAHERRQRLAISKTTQPAEPLVEPEEPVDIAIEGPIGGIARTADSPSLGRLAGKEQDPAVRKELMSALLARDDLRSVNVFLELVEDARTSADALDCVAAVPNPPVQTLFPCLRSSRAARRMAAAQVLGRLNRPEVSRELIGMVMRGLYRQEAMIALLSSSEPIAREFLANAERDPMLSATLWNAKRQFFNLLGRQSDSRPVAANGEWRNNCRPNMPLQLPSPHTVLRKS